MRACEKCGSTVGVGTRGRARCDLCRGRGSKGGEAWRTKERRLGDGGPAIPIVEKLMVTCWCEADVVRVSQTEIADGRTRSCGAPGCHELADTMAEVSA